MLKNPSKSKQIESLRVQVAYLDHVVATLVKALKDSGIIHQYNLSLYNPLYRSKINVTQLQKDIERLEEYLSKVWQKVNQKGGDKNGHD